MDELRRSELYNIENQLKLTPKNVLDFQNLGYSSHYVVFHGSYHINVIVKLNE